MKDMQDYREFVRFLSKSGDGRIFLNSDENCALEVLVEIFQNAQKEVRIFAGCLCKHVGNQPAYVIALSEFIERGGVLKILLNAYDENAAKESNLYKRLAYYKSLNKPITIKSTLAHPYRIGDPEKKEIHFTIGDRKAYRIETDIEKRTAECSLNNPNLANITADFFDMLFDKEENTEINIQTLFSDGYK